MESTVDISLQSPQLTADQLSRHWFKLGFPSRDAADMIAKLISTDTTMGERIEIFAKLTSGKDTFVTPTDALSSIEQNGFVDVPVSQESPIVNERLTNGIAIREAKQPTFSSLAVSLLEKNGKLQPGFPLNSREVVPVETDLFVGRMLMILRPIDPEDDPYWNDRIFSKRKRRIVLQLQGKFKRAPIGTVYAGGEISEQMRLGLFAKGICGILLKLVKSFAPDTHYSFGDNGAKEKPHIVIPAWSFFDRLVVTKPGEEPPELGQDFFEPEESVVARKNLKSRAQWNTDDTYSMSFYSMYMDLVKWQIVQLPVTSDIDLKTFWGNSFLRIVLYENNTPMKDARHLQKDNTYFFAIELRHLGLATKNQDGQQEEETLLPWEKLRPISQSHALGDIDRQESGMHLVELNSEEEYFFDAQEESVLREPEDEVSIPPESSVSIKLMDLLSTIDTVCPTMIEMYHKGKYRKVYAFNLTTKGVTDFRTAASVEEYFATSRSIQIIDQTWSPRLSTSERCRRILGHTISQALLDETPGGTARLKQFAELQMGCDQEFLRRTRPSWAARGKVKIRHSGYGARAVSDRHWLEEWIQITDRHIFFHHPDKQKAHFHVSLQSIVEVKRLPSEDAPSMPSFSFIAIGTLGRTIYLMFLGEVDCNGWVDLITGLVAMSNAIDQRSSLHPQSSCSDHSMALDDPADEFLHESSLWNCKQRRILNCRKFSFHCKNAQINDPASLVEDALVQAFEQSGDFDERGMIAFLDSAAALKDVEVNHLGEKERLAFFLNLYHVMIMHAFLVLGPPDSTFKSISYFNAIAYQCSDDIFSLTELEHCIIRAAMNYPSQFVSKFVLPKSQFRFALSQSDYRINFALNCGSVSIPEVVPIYRAITLDTQLDSAARCYLAYASEVRASCKHAGSVTITLPRICQWFADDFGNGSTNDVVRCIERFLGDSNRKLVAACFWEPEQRYNFNDLNVKYSSLSFECRNLKLDRS